MNGLNNAGIFPYSLNNLQVLSLEDGATLPVSCDVPLIRTLTSTNQEISLFESAPDLIDFDIYDKSLSVNTLFAGSGAINKLYTDEIQFNTNYTPTIALPTGYIYWDNSENRGTLSLQLDNDVNTHIGEDVYFRVKATENITKGNCVQFDGTLGSSGIILAKIATGATLNPQFMMGVASEDIADNDFGFITHFGYIRGVDTSLYPDGTLLYYNGTGGFTNVEPIAPNSKILMCAVVNQGNSSNGSIFVRPSLFPRLADINGVALLGEASKDLLIYDTNRWINQPRDTALNGIVLSSGTITNLTTNSINMTGSLNTNFLNFIIATGGYLSCTGTITTQQSLRTTNGINTFDFTEISSDGTTSIYNCGGADSGFSLRFDGTERLFLQSNTGDLILSTGTLRANNGLFSGGLSAPIANISCFAVSPSSFVFSPYYTGGRMEIGSVRANTGSFNNISATGMNLSNLVFTNATGGSLSSSLVIRNPQTLAFSKTDGTQIVRIEPAGVADVLSFFNPGGILQTLYTTSSSGANVDNLNQLGTKDITNLGRIFNGSGNQALPSYSFVDDTDSGFYRLGNNILGLSLGNRRNILFNPDNIFIGSGASNRVDLDIFGELHIGGTSNANSALMNLGYSGSRFGVNNIRMGYIFMDGTNMELNNQQATTGSNSVGSIFLTPAGSANYLIKRPNGQLISNARGSANDYTSFLVNFNTGAFGLVLQNPNSEGYLFSTQTYGNQSAHTMHGAVSNVMSNLTIGRTNFPFSAEEALTLRPWSNTGSRTTEIKIANTVNEAFGYTIMGMSPTGHTAGGKLVSNFGFISNSNPLGGFYICTNTNTTVPNTYPRYFVDASGNHEFSLSSITGCFSITSSAYSVGVGTSFSSTRGQGRYVPLSVASLTNTTYTGGTEYLVRGSSSSNNDHSAFTTNQFSADWKGVYDIRYNLNMNTATATDTVFIRIKVGGTTRQVSTHRIETVASNAQGSLLFNCTAGQLIELFIQGDVRNVSVNNDSTFTIMYQG